MNDLVRQGKVRYIGCSTHPAWVVQEAIMVSELRGYPRYISEQPPYNLLDRRIENELVPCARETAWGSSRGHPWRWGFSPVDTRRPASIRRAPGPSCGGGYADRVSDRGIEVGIEFTRSAKEAGLTPAQLAVLWCKDPAGDHRTSHRAPDRKAF